MGANALQWPHQGAKNFTNTIFDLSYTIESNVPGVNDFTLLGGPLNWMCKPIVNNSS